MIISGETINLRKITTDDTGLIVKWRNNKRVFDNFVFSERLTPEMHNQWLIEKVEKGIVEQFIIIEKETENPIGSVYFRDIDNEKREAEYGIFIGEDGAVGKGYGNETAKIALEYAFNEMKLDKVFLRVFEDNVPAIKSYEKAGFKPMDREELVTKNGQEKKLLFMQIERKQLK